MPATLRIVSWKASNLRCPDHEFNFCDAGGRPHQVSLLQMPNGTGKSTTLLLLRAALSGSADNNRWTPEKVRALRRRGASDKGRFEVVLLLNRKRATFIMNFDFEAGKVTYQTTDSEGQKNQFSPSGEFKRFLNENFVSFYVFDGELAHNLLSSEHTDAETVVEQLFQVNTLRTLADKVDEYWDHKTSNSERNPSRLTFHKNRITKLKARRSILEVEKRALESKLKVLGEQHSLKAATYDESIAKEEGVAKQRDDANARLMRVSVEVGNESRSVLDLMTQPQALSSNFAKAIYDLKTSLDRVKLPDSAAREFFAELAEEDECICGRCIDDQVRTVIQERAERYLGSDDVSLLNSMKTAIDDAVGKSRTEPNENLKNRVTKLTEIVTSQREAKDELSEIELEAEKSDPAVQKAKEALQILEAEIGQVTQKLQKFDSVDEWPNEEDIFGLALLDRLINEAEEKVAEITRTLDSKQKRDILKGILETAYQQAKLGITADICQQANARIEELMPYNDIRIDHIEQCLHLQEQSGGSIGEQLSVAYGFLATLFDRAEHKLPFVVDSPAGPIDLEVRSKIGALVPRLSGQFIAFTISSERQGFVPSLQNNSPTPIQYFTLFRKGNSLLAERARQSPRCTETEDGICVEDQMFFNEFQDEEVNG